MASINNNFKKLSCLLLVEDYFKITSYEYYKRYLGFFSDEILSSDLKCLVKLKLWPKIKWNQYLNLCPIFIIVWGAVGNTHRLLVLEENILTWDFTALFCCSTELQLQCGDQFRDHACKYVFFAYVWHV